MASPLLRAAEEPTNTVDTWEAARALLGRLADSSVPPCANRPSVEELERCLRAVLARAESIDSHRTVLLQQQAALRTVISSVPHFVFWKDQDCVYRGCNDIFAALGGLKNPDEIVGKTDYDMPWTKEQSDLYREDDLRVIRGGKPILNIEETNVDADGNEKVILTSKVPLQSEDGTIIGMLGIFADISARKQLEKELGRSKELAEAANRAKSDFLAAMSHELRTPLTLILGPLESLLAERKGELSAQVAQVLERLYRNAYRLKVLTDDILDFSKHQAGHLRLNAQPVQVAEHLRQLILDMAPAAASRGLTLDSTGVEDSLGTVLLDAAKFDKILINLVGNALKFTPEGGAISVSATLEEGDLLLRVQDTGIGIDPADHARLFRRFEQVDGTSKRQHGGTGLGLSLVKEFAELMGGSVRVESTLGHGATFSVQVPRALADQLPAPPSSHQGRPAGGLLGLEERIPNNAAPRSTAAPGAASVVVAEDSDDLRSYLSTLLGSEFRVIATADGQAAYEAVLREKPDVVVSDVMMPVMDGFELVAKLKADPELATIPILLLTARAGVEASADSMNRGADDYLSKPFSPLDLIARVRAAQRMKDLNSRLRDAEQRAAIAERLAGLGRLLAKLSHELNNPVNIIYNGSLPIEQYSRTLIDYAKACDAAIARTGGDESLAALREALEYDFVVEDLPGAVSTLREAARRVKDVQSSMRLFLQGRVVLKRAPADLNELVKSSLELTERGAGRALKTQLVLGNVPLFAFDRGRLSQALLNVLKNAEDAAGPQGRIVVETSSAGDLAKVTVSDNGPGVPQAVRDRIFEPFFTTKDVGLGTGLGLAISVEVVAQHGGRLYLDPHYEGGARFVIELPTTGEQECGANGEGSSSLGAPPAAALELPVSA